MKKKLFVIMILLFCSVPPADALVRNIQDNYQLIYTILDVYGDPVESETVTIKIKRMSDGYWLDFNDSTFKASGWTSKSTTLSEDTTEGYYYYTFDPPSSETGAEEYIFLVDNASATYGDHQSLVISYQNIGTAVDTDIDSQLATIQADLDNPSQYKADVSGLATASALATTQADLDNPDQYKATGFSTHSVSDIVTAMQAVSDDFKANVSGLATAAALATAQNDLDNPSQYKADVSGLATASALATTQADLDNPDQYKATGFSTHSVSDIVTAMQAVSDDFKANVSGLATAAALATAQNDLDNPSQYKATGFSTHSAADIWAVATREITGGTITTVSDKTGYSLSSAGIDAIWDEVQSGHSSSGTFGYYLDSQVSAAGGDPWNTSLPGAYTGTQAGKLLSDIYDATDGNMESGSYTGVENLIRRNR
jgi:hypothetical protein